MAQGAKASEMQAAAAIENQHLAVVLANRPRSAGRGHARLQTRVHVRQSRGHGLAVRHGQKLMVTRARKPLAQRAVGRAELDDPQTRMPELRNVHWRIVNRTNRVSGQWLSAQRRRGETIANRTARDKSIFVTHLPLFDGTKCDEQCVA